jgi:anti-sigma regulatory factor (Ser/Thr protein kinase)
MGGFRHEARFYEGSDGFVTATAPFVRAGLEADEAVLVVVDAPKIDWLRDELGNDAGEVRFADMAEVGRNPARIIPAWAAFARDTFAAGRTPRGIGEPFGPQRNPAATRECHLHESLLNTAFDRPDATPWRLLCPYDTSALEPGVLAAARTTHPFVDDQPSTDHRHLDPAAPFAEPLPDPPADVHVAAIDFDEDMLRLVRRAVRSACEAADVRARAADVVLAVNEAATNSTRYGGGRGRFRTWRDGDCLVFEVADAGCILDPLVGRVEPPQSQVGGRGLWLCNQLCDLVQVHSSPAGTVVRLHVDLRQADTPATARSYVST